MFRYLLITPAFNEEENIERTIRSVLSQTCLPVKWFIVSDGSRDRTDEIVKRYESNHGIIKLLRMPEHRDRNFAGKVNCFNEGYANARGLEYEIIGNLDADISFEEDYFEFLLKKFLENPNLGVAGTPFVEDGNHYDYRFTNIEHVSGACQLFRKKCFEEIGGYVPIKGGGIDWLAVTSARFKGWQTRTFTEKVCYHHRKMGTGNTSRLFAGIRNGKKDYSLGNHPMWEMARAMYQMTKRPYIFGGTLLISGYVWAALRRIEKPIPTHLVQFTRREQMKRLKAVFTKTFGQGGRCWYRRSLK
jgi:glycosyltransferase involved in cell wall biosynthesis